MDAPAGPLRTASSLTADLNDLGVVPGSTLIVHSSLSRLGWIPGGAQAVVEALTAALGPLGTLVMPTHSAELSEPSRWENPPVPEAWWPVIRAEMPAFDPVITPTLGMGAIVNCFRQWPGVLRSYHPKVSFAARGPNAEPVTSEHSLTDSLGDGSPLARVYDLDGYVLLLGVGHGNNTSLHLAEHRASWPSKTWIDEGGPVLVNGERQWVVYRDLDTDDSDFVEIGAAFGKVFGDAPLVRQRDIVDFAVGWIQRNRS